MGAFEAVQHQPLAALAAAAIRSAVMDGRLRPGAKIVEVQISAELGFSRAPLREALRILEEEGFVVRQPYRGSFVAEVSPQMVAEIASLRSRLEPYAAELALSRLRTAAGRKLLLGSLKSLRSAATKGDIGRCVEAHMLLHRAVYESSGHGLLLDAWQTWETKLRLHFAVDASSLIDRSSLVDDHEKLVTLLLEGDLPQLAAEIRDHVQPALHTTPETHV